MLKIRLKRFGKKHRPFYRIAVMPARTKRQSSTVEELGFIDPISKEVKLNEERAKYWISVGAQPTYSVERLFIRKNILKAPEKTSFKMKPGKKSQERKAAKAEKPQEKAEAKAETEEKPAS